MGTNKRYAASLDRRADQRDLERLAAATKPASLKTVELELDREPLTRPPAPLPVRAWVRYGDRPFRVDAELIQWTERACAISWHIEGVGEQKAWVWSSAVRPR